MSGDAKTFHEHVARDAALRELHARPPIEITGDDAAITRFVFTYEPSYAGRDDDLIRAFCVEADIDPPAPRARALQFIWRGLEARWERHNEFVTYTFIAHGEGGAAALHEANRRLLQDQPGPLVAKLSLAITRKARAEFEADPRFVCASSVRNKRALLETSFTADESGAVRFNLTCADMTDAEVGALAQQVMEIEMYRMLALLALPIARQVGSTVRDTEIQLGALTHRLSAPTSAEAVEAFFNELTAISGGIEMEIAASTYRFAAARAYGALVEERLARLHEAKFDGRQRVSSFMRTRLIPALRTCESMQLALADLANRTSRLLDLIRTRIDLQLAQQNVDLLTVINKRTHLQLRLQQTVEGLSVAAISYYVIALLSYVTEGAESAHLIKIDSGVMNAFLAPVVVVGMWFSVRRLRKKHQVD